MTRTLERCAICKTMKKDCSKCFGAWFCLDCCKYQTYAKCDVCKTMKRNCRKSFDRWFCEGCYQYHDSLDMLQKIARYKRQEESKK